MNGNSDGPIKAARHVRIQNTTMMVDTVFGALPSRLALPAELAEYFEQRARRVNVADNQEAVAIAVREVDKIDKSVVGALDTLALYRHAPTFSKHGIATCRGIEPLVWRAEVEVQQVIAARGVPKQRTVSRGTFAVLESLQTESDLYELVERPQTPFRCGAFLVEKKLVEGRVKLRVIMDAREPNAYIDTSGYGFSLFTIETLIRKISALQHAKTWYAHNCDLRHFFHQIRMDKSLCENFVFEERTPAGQNPRFLRARTVPMGFVGGPYIAQCCSMALLFFSQEPDAPFTDEAARALGLDPVTINRMCAARELPTLVPLIDGFIVVLIDNMLIVTTNKQVALNWKKRLHNAHRTFGVIFKAAVPGAADGPPPDFIELTATNGAYFNFCGVCWAHGKRWIPVDKSQPLPHLDGQLTWRGSHSGLASVMGTLHWHIRVWSMSQIDDDMRRLRRVWQIVTPRTQLNIEPTKTDWAQQVEVPQQQLDVVKKFWTLRGQQDEFNACANNIEKPLIIDRVFFAAVDADMQRTGLVRYCHLLAGVLHKSCLPHHCTFIQQAELLAIVLAVEAAVEGHEHHRLLIVATDNMVAKRWVESLKTEDDEANTLLERLVQVLAKYDFILKLVYVNTKKNGADPVSRGEFRCDDEQLQRHVATCDILLLEWTNWKHYPRTRSTGTRVDEREIGNVVRDENDFCRFRRREETENDDG